jgi:hypothetical protein
VRVRSDRQAATRDAKALDDVSHNLAHSASGLRGVFAQPTIAMQVIFTMSCQPHSSHNLLLVFDHEDLRCRRGFGPASEIFPLLRIYQELGRQ